MFFIATAGGGMCTAFPDVCKVPAPPAPPIPTPFPNMAMLMQANRATCALKVKIMNMPVVHVNSMIPMTSGDEAGSLGGVVSGMIKGPAKFTKGSLKVKVMGMPVAFQTCPIGQNGTNANAPLGIHDTPSQPKVSVAF
jgi:Domain of unknown function (DUF4150)